jgi:hypothetical protein
MKKRRYVLGFAGVILAVSFVLAGCPIDSEEEDSWSNVTSLNQMNGTWKGSYSQTQAIKEFIGEEWNESMGQLLGDIKVTTSAEMTQTINAGAKTWAAVIKMTVTFSGGNTSVLWGTIKENMGVSGATFDDTKHSMTYTYDEPAQPLSDGQISEMLASGIQINQNGTKIKMPAGAMEEGSPEIIFVKQ